MSIKTLALLAALSCSAVLAQTVEVKDAWVRSSVPGQKATGAFMKITAKEAAKLVGASSPAAGVVEIHEMKMEGDVMKMRAVAGGLELPAGKTVELKPGGYHIMLMDLKAALAKDSNLALTLLLRDDKGHESKLELKLPVITSAPGAKPAGMPGMDHSQHKH